jgi:hypothetical protein
MEPYYADDFVTLFHGDCREVADWLAADVLVTDPPYGIGWSKGKWANSRNSVAHEGIIGDADTGVRDAALAAWAAVRPALVFGSLRAAYPDGWKRMLVFHKPVMNTGLFGNRMPWLANWEPVFVLGEWPDQTPALDAVIGTRAVTAGGYSGYATRYGHCHAKPVDVMETLIAACPPGVIADPFAGSGSTLVAARNLGRRAIGVEIDEAYCEKAANRLSQGVFDLATVTS